MRLASIALLLCGVIVFIVLIWPEPTVTYAPGLLAPDEPIQQNLQETRSWEADDYTVTALADFDIRARVLHRKAYGTGRESDLSPLDLALGWGPLSDQTVIDELDFSQKSRWYFWRTDALPLPAREIETHSANMHLIPADEMVEERMDDVVRGDLIQMKGFLVRVDAKDGWKWKSSLRRDDRGDGACEIVWVESLEILTPVALPE